MGLWWAKQDVTRTIRGQLSEKCPINQVPRFSLSGSGGVPLFVTNNYSLIKWEWKMIKRITHNPKRMDRKTEIELSWYFLLAIIPMIKAMMLAGNVTPTVTSHQRSSKFSTLKIFTSMIEAIIAIRKKMFSPTDHLPNFVCGLSFIRLLYLKEKQASRCTRRRL